MKIVIAGANGYLGRVLTHYYAEKKYDVVALTRTLFDFGSGVRNILWDGKTAHSSWACSLNDADVLINLTGKSVDCRYTQANRQAIFDSRTSATEALCNAINNCPHPPKLWINAASATIYRHADDRPMDEITGEIGNGFSVDVCQKWEKTFFDSATPNTRQVALRIAIVLGPLSNVVQKLKTLTLFGLGGKQGHGRQKFSWIDERDLCEIVDFVCKNKHLEGIYNASSPNPIDNANLMKWIRQVLQVPFGLPAPKWLLEIGALLLGTETELILKSRWVLPCKLTEDGFIFRFPHIEHTLSHALGHK